MKDIQIGKLILSIALAVAICYGIAALILTLSQSIVGMWLLGCGCTLFCILSLTYVIYLCTDLV